MSGIEYAPKSILGFLIAVSFVAWLGGTYISSYEPNIGAQLSGIGFPIFVICFAIWLIYIFLGLSSRVGR